MPERVPDRLERVFARSQRHLPVDLDALRHFVLGHILTARGCKHITLPDISSARACVMSLKFAMVCADPGSTRTGVSEARSQAKCWTASRCRSA
jgi:hypothetical protein